MGLSLLRRRRRKGEPCGGGKAGMRIADVLREPEEEGDACSCDEGRKGWKVSSPIWVCSRWAVSAQKAAALHGREEEGRRSGCWVFMGGRKGVVEWREEAVVADAEAAYSSSSCFSPGEITAAEEAVKKEKGVGGGGGGVLEEGGECGVEGKEVEKIHASQSSSGKSPDEISVSFGLGVGLLFLLARSVSVFNKMVEMRKEVEEMLKEVNGVINRKDLIEGSTESKNHLAFAATHSCEDESPSHLTHKTLLPNRSPSFHMTETPAEHDEHSSDSMECSQNLDKLQDEFVSEIEQLQIGMNDGHNEYPNHKVEMTGTNSDVSEASSASSETDLGVTGNEEQEIDESCQYGVCPRELERRLHKLLQVRQQERIEELETALQHAERKLREKEMEICWWRDTAQIVSHHQHSEEVCR